MATGKIGVTTENIFPVIKKFLYSDHEIFLRELVSNAVDATRKLKTLTAFGDYKGDLGEMDVRVSIDKEAGTLTVSDHGIGMDAADIERYINQIAFSGAEEFLEKYKDTANSIIGHFGLGFYSAFMVAKKVVIRSLSYKEGAKAVEWSCDGSPEFEMHEIEKEGRGTDVVLFIDDDNKEFLEQVRIDTLLKKYCRFLPVPVISGKEQEWKDGKYVDTDKDRVINATEPLWTRKPADLTDKDYMEFYHELMPGQEDPMFYIHLNVDYPFTLTGILYFPKVKSNIDLQKNRIQLYCNQVYVTDQVEGVVPEFMMLMQGVIDSPDIPLNVSRSYLQADTAVKKISSYISKKVAEKLDKMFRENRSEFEAKWNDIRLFIEYGMLTDEKFFDQARNFFLVEDTEGKFFTLDEYRQLTEAEQTNKDSELIWLYSTDKEAQYSYINAAREKGYSVLLLNDQLDPHIIGLLESKLERTHLVRVDSDIPERLIAKAGDAANGLSPLQTDILSSLFRANIPTVEKAEFLVQFEALRSDGLPATITQGEHMRRMKEMAALQPGMSFFGELPDNYALVVNTANPAVESIIAKATEALSPKVEPIRKQIDELNEAIKENKDKEENEKKVAALREEESKAIAEWKDSSAEIEQIVDLALLGANLLKGEALTAFIARSASMLKK